MFVKGRIKTGEYFDSVSLMIVGRDVSALDGVIDAAVVMGTRENQAILASAGLLLPEFENANDSDLLIAVKCEDEQTIEGLFERIDDLLQQSRKKASTDTEYRPRSLDSALKALPDARLALISVAGKYAAREAMQALERGLHVMIFSDNVSIEDEVELKTFARDRGLLVMGPDCGTAIINGIPLAFANEVARGDIGLVAASGTGLQELTCLISNAGCGVSQAIGTGGRDIKEAVGGIMFLEGLNALVDDPKTKVIVLVGKPPHPSVLEKIWNVTKTSSKKFVAIFQGTDATPCGDSNVHLAKTLHEAAMKAVALSRGTAVDQVTLSLDASMEKLAAVASLPTPSARGERKYLRGLFSGGTFCVEAQVVLGTLLPGLCSNVPLPGVEKLGKALESRGHTVIDLGEDEFTVGRPHPMIDYALRNKRIRQEAQDPETAVILLDVVLGHGSNPDPAGELVPVVTEAAGKVNVVCSVTGTDLDPQNRSSVERALVSAGALVAPSNAAACHIAGHILRSGRD